MALNLQMLLPTVVTANSQQIVADIDGDQINELIALDGNLKELSVVHQFKYNDITYNDIASAFSSNAPVWDDPALHWMTIWGAQQGAVPGGWNLRCDDAALAADLDGDGADELFIYNLSYPSWGVLKWQSNGLQTLCQIQMPANNPIWPVALGDQYYIIPNFLSPNVTGILAFNSQTQAMGLITYSSGKFSQFWLNSGTSLGGWNLRISDQFYVAMFVSKTTPFIAIHNPDDGDTALLEWNGAGFNVQTQGSPVGDWRFDPADQLQCADLDGDGLEEIFVYAPSDGFIGVLKWSTADSQFHSLVVTNSQIGSAPNVWTIGGSDQYYCVNINGPNAPAGIYAYSPDRLLVALLSLKQLSPTNQEFTCQWAGQHLLPDSGWPVQKDDSYLAPIPSGAATPVLFAVSMQESKEQITALTLGAVAWNGSAPAPALSISSRATVPVLAWSPSFLATAPHTHFTPFQGNQDAIYQYISKQYPDFNSPPSVPVTNQIRTIYKNELYKNTFQPFADTIPANTPNASWIQADWNAVVLTIVAECEAVDVVYNMYTAIANLATAFNAMQVNDLGMVQTNIQKATQTPPSSSVHYWLGQLAVAAMWGLGAALGAPEAAALKVAGVICSVSASILGSRLSYDPTQQQADTYSQMTQQITGTFSSSFFTASKDSSRFLDDPVKLKICNQLAGGDWAIPAASWADNDIAYSNLDRLWMYETLMPAVFQVWRVQASVPFGPAENNVIFTANGYRYGLRTADGGVFISPAQFQSLADDLFTTLGVSNSDFFLRVGPWQAFTQV